MNQDEVLEAFKTYGVLETGHFQLSSGRHSDFYLQKQRLFEYPKLTARLAEAMCKQFPAGSFDVVASPAVGAILLGGLVAYSADTRFVFTERDESTMRLRRGQTLGIGERVLVVEDIVTTGGSAGEVVRLIEEMGAELTGVAVLADRSMEPPPFKVVSLLKIEGRDWDPAECPLCAQGQPLDAPGSRYLAGP
ncbi:MAG: orotate phosphoribosyltransferase [Actinomycetota bacterium]